MPGFPPPLPPGGYVDLPDRGRMWVWDSGGDGVPVLLLHGWTSTAALNWSPSMMALGRRFRVIAPDQQGHGRGLRDRRFSLEGCAADAAALLGVLGCPPAVVVGYSMGGPVAMLTVRRHPEVVRGLVLAATALRFSGRPDLAPAVTALGAGLSALLASVPAGWHRGMFERMAMARDPDADRARWVVAEQGGSDPASLIQAGAALNAFDATDWVGTLDVPAWVLITSRDQTVAPTAQWRLARSLPGAGHTTLPAGHRACVEQAEQFVPALVAACTAVTGSARAGGSEAEAD